MTRPRGTPPPPPRRFLGIRVRVWFGMAKWFSIAGAGLAALISAIAGAVKVFH